MGTHSARGAMSAVQRGTRGMIADKVPGGDLCMWSLVRCSAAVSSLHAQLSPNLRI